MQLGRLAERPPHGIWLRRDRLEAKSADAPAQFIRQGPGPLGFDPHVGYHRHQEGEGVLVHQAIGRRIRGELCRAAAQLRGQGASVDQQGVSDSATTWARRRNRRLWCSFNRSCQFGDRGIPRRSFAEAGSGARREWPRPSGRPP